MNMQLSVRGFVCRCLAYSTIASCVAIAVPEIASAEGGWIQNGIDAYISKGVQDKLKTGAGIIGNIASDPDKARDTAIAGTGYLINDLKENGLSGVGSTVKTGINSATLTEEDRDRMSREHKERTRQKAEERKAAEARREQEKKDTAAFLDQMAPVLDQFLHETSQERQAEKDAAADAHEKSQAEFERQMQRLNDGVMPKEEAEAFRQQLKDSPPPWLEQRTLETIDAGLDAYRQRHEEPKPEEPPKPETPPPMPAPVVAPASPNQRTPEEQEADRIALEEAMKPKPKPQDEAADAVQQLLTEPEKPETPPPPPPERPPVEPPKDPPVEAGGDEQTQVPPTDDGAAIALVLDILEHEIQAEAAANPDGPQPGPTYDPTSRVEGLTQEELAEKRRQAREAVANDDRRRQRASQIDGWLTQQEAEARAAREAEEARRREQIAQQQQQQQQQYYYYEEPTYQYYYEPVYDWVPQWNWGYGGGWGGGSGGGHHGGGMIYDH